MSAAPILQPRSPVFDLFPRLKERRQQFAGTMGGGEQQMLVAAALMAAERQRISGNPQVTEACKP
jgi:ABC-type branched-subunit amino acid transport system ATPase component